MSAASRCGTPSSGARLPQVLLDQPPGQRRREQRLARATVWIPSTSRSGGVALSRKPGGAGARARRTRSGRGRTSSAPAPGWAARPRSARGSRRSRRAPASGCPSAPRRGRSAGPRRPPPGRRPRCRPPRSRGPPAPAASPDRTRSWSSATTTRGHGGHRRGQRDRPPRPRTGRRVRPVAERAAEQRHPLGHAQQAESRAACRVPGPIAVGAPDPQRRRPRSSTRQRGRPSACFSALVSASCTTRYADTSTPPGGGAVGQVEPASTASPPSRNSLDQRGHVGEAGRRLQPELVGVVADQVQQPAGLGQRPPPGLGHRLQQRRGPVRVGAGPGPGPPPSAPPSRSPSGRSRRAARGRSGPARRGPPGRAAARTAGPAARTARPACA